jgi:penicillin-binding protein 1A
MAFFESRTSRILVSSMGLLVVAAVGAWVAFYLTFLRDLPDLHSVEDYQPPIASRVLDRDGVVIGSFFEERRTLVPLGSVPNHVVQAFVAGEDSSFFEHSGIDYRSILRAAWVNLRAGGEIKQGASTITQQMVKGLLLTPERKLRRKIREMILARRIERRFSKQEILYLYLNQIYFGHGAYGIDEAARTYFGKNAGTLSVSEGALLAGLPKAPSRYSPFRNPEEAEERRRYVLSRMDTEGALDAAGYAAAVADVPILTELSTAKDDPAAAYFNEEVRRYLFDRLGSDLVLRGGLTIETTLDQKLQREANRAVKRGLVELDHRQGYRGPLRQLAVADIPAEIERLAEANHLEIEPGELEPPTEPEELESVADLEQPEPSIELADTALPELPGEPEWNAARAILTQEGGTLLGVVTQVDATSESARVSFAPGVHGIVRLEDVRWAREPDPERSPYEIRSIESVFAVGDVAHFSAAPPHQDGPGDAAVIEAPALRITLDQQPEVEGSLLSVEVDSNDVLALVGGYDFNRSQFNRVTQARRQPGSAFKAIIYAAALSRNYTPASIVFDRPVVYTDEASGFIWRPRNYKRSFYGPITLREALARSVNNATVHLFRDVGIDFVIEYARRLGIESPLSRDLSLALGSSGVSLLELTRAYGVFPAGGRRVVPIFIRRVTDRQGQVLLENVELGAAGDALEPGEPPEETEQDFIDVAAAAPTADAEPTQDPDQVISPEEAYLAVSLLRAVVEDPNGTGWRLRALKRPLAGKTGTTNDQADAWFMGFSPDVVTGVWVGHDVSRFLGIGETGSKAAAPIWVDYMRSALEGRPARDFPIPDPIVFARIDRKTGLLADANSSETVFQAFLQGTVPTETASSARTTSESRRQLRLDSF